MFQPRIHQVSKFALLKTCKTGKHWFYAFYQIANYSPFLVLFWTNVSIYTKNIRMSVCPCFMTGMKNFKSKEKWTSICMLWNVLGSVPTGYVFQSIGYTIMGGGGTTTTGGTTEECLTACTNDATCEVCQWFCYC